MLTYYIRIESGAIAAMITVKAANSRTARVDALDAFAQQYPHRAENAEITGFCQATSNRYPRTR